MGAKVAGSLSQTRVAILICVKCWHCGKTAEVRERVGFRDECSGCGRALHVCRNCQFYDISYNNACRETQAERVVDKERFNFCEYFAPGIGTGSAAAASQAKASTQAKLEALFKKKS